MLKAILNVVRYIPYSVFECRMNFYYLITVAIVQLQQERVNGMEGQNISVCTVLSSIAGEVRRPLLINVMVTSASADSKYPHTKSWIFN